MALRKSDNDCVVVVPIIGSLPSTINGNHQSQYQNNHGPSVANLDLNKTDFHACPPFPLHELQTNNFNGSQPDPFNEVHNSNYGVIPNIYNDTATPYFAPQLDAGSSFDGQGSLSAFELNNAEEFGGSLSGIGAFDLNNVENFSGSMVDNAAWGQDTMGTDPSNLIHSFPTCLANSNAMHPSYPMSPGYSMPSFNENSNTAPSSRQIAHSLSGFPSGNFGQHFPVAGLAHRLPNGFDANHPMSFFGSDDVSQQTSVAAPASSFIADLHQSLPDMSQHTGQALVPQAAPRPPINTASHPFPCGHHGCGKRFKRKGDCVRHGRSHSIPQFQCADANCTKASYRKDKVVDHQRRVHGM